MAEKLYRAPSRYNPAGPNHLSVSQLKKLIGGCAKQWEFEKVMGLAERPSNALVEGVCFHVGVETVQMARKERFGWTREQEEEKAISALRGAWAQYLSEVPGGAKGIEWRKGSNPEISYALTERLTQAYLRNTPITGGSPLVDQEHFVAVEDPFEVAVPGIPNWTIMGRMDGRSIDGWIIDNKTAGKAYAQNTMDADIQAYVYLWAWFKKTGEIAPGMKYHVVIKPRFPEGAFPPTGLGSYRTASYATTRTYEQLMWFEDVLRDAVLMVEMASLPRNPAYIYCGTCPWKKDCMPHAIQADPADPADTNDAE